MSGPYKVDEWVAKDHVTISRWAGYARRLPWSDHDGPGYVDRVVSKFIPDAGVRSATVESGETQLATVLTPRDVDRLRGAGVQIVSTLWGGAGTSLFLNVSKYPTDELKVRQAVVSALDPDPLLSNIYTGVRANGPLTANVLDDASLHTRASAPDPVTASSLLDEAGWQPGSDGIRTRDGQRLTFVLNGISDSALALGGGPYPYIQGQLRQIGIEVCVKLQL
jgi:peptide/nickel transport system substrate-binding protein